MIRKQTFDRIDGAFGGAAVLPDRIFGARSEIRAGRIHAEIKVPDRKPIPMLKLRLRHPEGKRILSASVNGSSAIVDGDGETICVKSPAGTLCIEIHY